VEPSSGPPAPTASVQYAAPAPGYVAGLEQVNIEIPPELLAGNNLLNMTIGTRTNIGAVAAVSSLFLPLSLPPTASWWQQ
jgi:hypothetical protein